MNKTKLRNYAKLLARVGLNVKKNQEVIVQAELDQPDFVYMCVEELYKAGASKVMVEWFHQPLSKLHYKYRNKKTLAKIEDWEIEKYKWKVDALPCLLYLTSEDPDGLNGVDQDKVSYAQQMRYPIIKPFIDQLDNKYQWCIAAVPGDAWAKKIFPNLSKKQREDALWENILKCARAFDGNAIDNWNKHVNDLEKRSNYLNSLNLKELKYKSSNGTDLTIGLNSEGLFCSAGETTLNGNFFIANIPSEEVFTSPMKGKCEGIVYSTKPLSYRGELIEDFNIKFIGGKAVEVHALKNEELLKKLITEDEGAAYLGECALVPFDSPINLTNLLFYNTLFDENACCHLALGRGFTNTIKDYDKYSVDELYNKGVNKSMIHEDFMIGSRDLEIKGIKDNGEEVLIFKNGTWAF